MLDLNKKYTLNNRATDLIILATCLEEIILWFSSVRTTMERSDQKCVCSMGHMDAMSDKHLGEIDSKCHISLKTWAQVGFW